jgi:large subunit ribosomal protein L23
MSIIVKPIVQSEKAVMLQEKRNQYSFIVAENANKIEIAEAVAEIYSVEVESVNTMKYGGGKKKMKYTTKGVSYERNKTFKKAIVTLNEGDVIDFYSAI